jgi:hypothetical protein
MIRSEKLNESSAVKDEDQWGDTLACHGRMGLA